MTIVSGKKSSTLYMTSEGFGSVAFTESKEDPNLWHQRLGHISGKGHKVMQSKGKLLGIKSVDFEMCESCKC